MVARATAPNRIGPGSVFPDASTWDFEEGLQGSPMASPVFWIALICQIVIVVGYFWFYRKEQLCKCLDWAHLSNSNTLFYSSSLILSTHLLLRLPYHITLFGLAFQL